MFVSFMYVSNTCPSWPLNFWHVANFKTHVYVYVYGMVYTYMYTLYVNVLHSCMYPTLTPRYGQLAFQYLARR